MKTIRKTLTIIAMLVMATVSFATPHNPSDFDDTIPAVPRCDDYYYTKWIDDCPHWRPNGVWDSCFCILYNFHCFTWGADIAKWERANGRMKVKGLVAMVQHYNSPTAAASGAKLPEYLYLYQCTGYHHLLLDDWEDGVDLVLLDSVRWDTATARVMELHRGWNDDTNQFCYLYEAYFENPVWVDTDFYIVGSRNCYYAGSGIIPTVYQDIMDLGFYMLNEKYGCTLTDEYYDLIATGSSVFTSHRCQPEGRYYAIVDQLMPQMGWYNDWPYSPVGYYLAIVDWWNVNAAPNDTAFGEVLGSGRFPDGSNDTIEAIPAPGFVFVSWSDGNTENPRVVQLASDTSFVAIFQSAQLFSLQVTSSDETMGSVTGGGNYYASDVIISAMPAIGHRFSHWSCGDAQNPESETHIYSNPLVVHLVSDTAFVAHFEDISDQMFNIQASSADETMGTVTGGGSHPGGTIQIVTAVPSDNRYRFSHWICGDVQNPGFEDQSFSNPLMVYLTCDTTFVAHFAELPQYTVLTATNNDEWGTVEGGGVYVEGEQATLTAAPAMSCVFEGWSDGETDMPRIVTVTQDTLFTAIFSFDSASIELPQYTVLTATNNDEWGTVEGGGVYAEGEQATLTAAPAMSYVFEGWSDGETDMPRIVTVTQDTLFMAIFSFDSASIEGIENAGTLEFTLSPNPTNGMLTLKTSQPDDYEVTIFNVNGTKLMDKKTNEPLIEIDLSSFPSGQYLILLRNKEKYGIKTIVKK